MARDAETFGVFYRRHAVALFRYILLWIGSAETAAAGRDCDGNRQLWRGSLSFQLRSLPPRSTGSTTGPRARECAVAPGHPVPCRPVGLQGFLYRVCSHRSAVRMAEHDS